tara:strand:- start:1921 stop:3312 length:1392 start_codon:yes stop_codon:yes gene_type:complete
MNPEKLGEQIAKRLLLEEFTEKVSLYPGAFKPPHKGHVATALKAIDDKTDRVIIFMSTKERDGVSVEKAQQVWDLYKQNNPELEKIEIVQTPVPVTAVYDYAKDNPSHDIRAVFGKGEESRFKRLLDKEKYPHVEVFDAGMEGTYSATDLRKAIRDNDLETINEFIPDGINVDDFMSIFQLNEAIVGDEIVCDNCGWHWKIVDGGDDLFICHKCGYDNTPLNEDDPKKGTGKKPKGSGRRLYTDEDPSDTVKVKFSTRQDIVNTLNKTSFKNKSHARKSQVINLIHQRVRAALGRTKDPLKKAKLKSAFKYIKQRKEASKRKTQRMKKEDRYLQEARYKKFLNEGWDSSKGKIIGDFVNYVSEYLSINKPKIKLINSPDYTQTYHSFGGYLPSEEKLMVVVHNRNMADILRTVAHEMVHHMQNLDDRLTPNSGEDGSPDENEANSLAAVIMRKFGRENPHIYE